MSKMKFTIGIGALAGSINDIARVASRLGVIFSYAKTGGLLYRHYECVAIGAKDDLLSFRSYLRLIAGDFA